MSDIIVQYVRNKDCRSPTILELSKRPTSRNSLTKPHALWNVKEFSAHLSPVIFMINSDNKPTQSLYSILGLPSPLSGRYFSTQQVRAAFRHVLLLHHPDKAASIGVSTDTSVIAPGETPSKYSVDDICHARDILVDPYQRRNYDRELAHKAVLLSSRTSDISNGSLATSEQIEMVDLDDMDYSENLQTWTRACRCGNAKAYEVSEADLTNAMAQGYREISVGCEGCSLHVRVTFEVSDETDYREEDVQSSAAF